MVLAKRKLAKKKAGENQNGGPIKVLVTKTLDRARRLLLS